MLLVCFSGLIAEHILKTFRKVEKLLGHIFFHKKKILWDKWTVTKEHRLQEQDKIPVSWFQIIPDVTPRNIKSTVLVCERDRQHETLRMCEWQREGRETHTPCFRFQLSAAVEGEESQLGNPSLLAELQDGVHHCHCLFPTSFPLENFKGTLEKSTKAQNFLSLIFFPRVWSH